MATKIKKNAINLKGKNDDIIINPVPVGLKSRRPEP